MTLITIENYGEPEKLERIVNLIDEKLEDKFSSRILNYLNMKGKSIIFIED